MMHIGSIRNSAIKSTKYSALFSVKPNALWSFICKETKSPGMTWDKEWRDGTESYGKNGRTAQYPGMTWNREWRQGARVLGKERTASVIQQCSD